MVRMIKRYKHINLPPVKQPTGAFYTLFLFSLYFGLVMSCANPEDHDPHSGFTTEVIQVSDVKVDLPVKEGHELVQAHCIICHSLRYIEMQPDMSRKSWQKLVSKMIKNFGAPVQDTMIEKKIVDYLVSIKGTDPH